MDSRIKFEKWFLDAYGCYLSGFTNGDILFAVWMGGRESMRAEVIPIVYGNCDSDNAAKRTVDAIQKIEL